MERISVDAPPATAWDALRPAGLAPQLWAETRPTQDTLARLALPHGTVVRGDEGQLLGWESEPGADADLAGLWLHCARQFPHTGLWPLVDAPSLEPFRGWSAVRRRDGKAYWREPYAIPSDAFDAANIADRSNRFNDLKGEPAFVRMLREDFGFVETSMTLARRSEMPPDPLSLLVKPGTVGQLTLVACRRPADSVLLLDFGVANDSATPGIFTGVLRSWEVRFGVLPVWLDGNWTLFQVLAPPTEEVEVERLAAEAIAFAEDSAGQRGFHISDHDCEVSAREMVRSREWLIWWD